jgi:hypothetical protein
MLNFGGGRSISYQVAQLLVAGLDDSANAPRARREWEDRPDVVDASGRSDEHEVQWIDRVRFRAAAATPDKAHEPFADEYVSSLLGIGYPRWRRIGAFGC